MRVDRVESVYVEQPMLGRKVISDAFVPQS